MEFNQVDKCVFEVPIYSCGGIGKMTDEGIMFFNSIFNVRVLSINLDLDNMKMEFELERDISYYDKRGIGEHTIDWMKADYKVHWKVNAVTLKKNTTKEALKDIQANDNIIFRDTVVVDYIEKV